MNNHIKNLKEKLYDVYTYYFDLLLFLFINTITRNKITRKIDKVVILENWVIYYDVLVIKNLNINNVILSTSKNWHTIFSHSPKNIEEAKKYFPSILKNLIHIDGFGKNNIPFNNDEYFFKKIKLQPLSEYISEQRNLQLNKLINEK